MGLKRVITGSWSRFMRGGDRTAEPSSEPIESAVERTKRPTTSPALERTTPSPAGEPPTAAEPSPVGTPRDRVGELFSAAAGNAGEARGAKSDPVMAALLLRFWGEFFVRFREDEKAFEQPRYQAEAAAIQELLAKLGGKTLPDLATCRAMMAVLVRFQSERYRELNERINELQNASQTYKRQAGTAELNLCHLRDELARCQALVEQERVQRGLPGGEPVAEQSLHDQIDRLFKAIAEQASKNSFPASAAGDPVLKALESVLISGDPSQLRSFPDWMRKNAQRILDLVTERNRYKRLLEHAGMLPTEPSGGSPTVPGTGRF